MLRIIGVMSGTSLDGLDLALCQFTDKGEGNVDYKIEAAQTFMYDEKMKNTLKDAMQLSGVELTKLDRNYGRFIGESINTFILQHQLAKDCISYIASHGHTVFHCPKEKYTLQIGHGGTIACVCGIPTICDFRSNDVALGGQGAPLVPIGDKLLFKEYEYCLNIGGIINISYDDDNAAKVNGESPRKAFDVSPSNIILNAITQQYFQEDYDKDGRLASSGKVNVGLLEQLEQAQFFSKVGPKSLGKEDVDRDFMPILQSSEISAVDKLATVVEMMARQIAKVFIQRKNKTAIERNSRILVTGGGAYNKYFIERLENEIKKLSVSGKDEDIDNSSIDVIVPDRLIVEFKEALIFAFLGYLRIKEQPNCLQSVTGAMKDNIGGCIYMA